MSYEINEVVIIDGSRNIVNAGVGTFSKVHPAELEVGSGGHSISDVLNETDLNSDSQTALPTQHAVKAYVDAAITAVQSDVDANELASDNAESALDLRLDALEVDPTTQTLLDAEETARESADSALSGRLDTLEADPTTATALAAVQADVDANELASDNAESALSGRLDTLEADPTTATALAAVQADVDANELAYLSLDASEASARQSADNALSGRLDTLEADPTTATALASAAAVAAAAAAANEVHIDKAATLSGVAKDSENLGTFTGTTISDSSTIKAALQDLENGVDNALGGGAAATSVEVVTLATDATHYLTFVNADNGTGTQENLYTDAGIQYNPSSDILTVGEVVISGNLTVNGTQTIFDTTVIQAQDKNITLGVTTAPTDAGADGGGLTLMGTTNKTFNWINATDAFTASEHISIAASKEYRIGGVKVVDSTSLGSLVVDSSLTSVGDLTDLTVTGDITANGNITGDSLTDITGIRTMHSEFITIANVNLNASATELNYLDGSLTGTAVASKAVVLDASKDIAGINNIDIAGNLVGDGASNISGINTVTAAGKMYALSYTSTSDANLKENVEKIEGAVEKVEAIRGVTFDWKDGSGSTAGIIAQEVEAVMPMLVENGEFKRVEYNGLVGLLIEAVKELSAEVKALKAN